MRTKLMFWLFMISVLFDACKKNHDFGPVYLENSDTNTISDNATYLLVGCEGTFQLGNASISLIDLDSSRVKNNAYFDENGRAIGDVLQSIKVIDDFIYVVVNNSGLVKKLDSNLYEVGEVKGLISPRYVELLGNRLIVSDLYANKLSIIDTQSLGVVGEVPLEGWTERLVQFQDKIIVEIVDKKQLVEILSDGRLGRQLNLSFEPIQVMTLGEKLLICGNYSNQNSSVVMVLNDRLETLDSISVDQKLVNADLIGDTLFVLTDSHVRMFEMTIAEEVKSLIHNVQDAYGILADRKFGVFVCDAKDYLSNGEVFRFDISLTHKIRSYSVGIIPQAMVIVERP
ncbi:MAG: hypothetical protein R2813_08270 [Flavobacteriales bacterium]